MTEEPSSTEKLVAAPSVAVSLSKTLDEKFKILSVMESDVDSYTIEAERLDDDRYVILRLLKPDAASHLVIKERFNAEVSRLQALVHHNVPRFLETGVTASGQPYAVFVHFDGKSLRKILDEDSCLKVDRAVNVCKQACAALTAAHRLGISEHNLSPRNIYLTKVNSEVDVVKMPAVGFVETAPAVGETYMHAPQNFSQNDSVVYKSPEACLGKNLDERSTVYSLGCLLFELLTGTVPILGRTALETANRHVKEKPLLLEDVRPDLRFPRELQDVVNKALEKEASSRYQTILEMQYALKKIDIIEVPSAWARPKKIPMDLKSNIRTILPGEITSWNLIASHRKGDDRQELPRNIIAQIISICAIGFLAIFLLFDVNAYWWVLPLIGVCCVRLLWLAQPGSKPPNLPPPGYGKIATSSKD